jgi:quinoprotein glucose dehydrogenase
MFVCRGVAVWRGPSGTEGPCTKRILTATADLRLIALDLEDGKPCADFGQDGAVRIDPGKLLLWPGEFQFTSLPGVIGDLVILGSSIGDNQRVDAPRGTVRAFDVRTGAPRWRWDPVPDRAERQFECQGTGADERGSLVRSWASGLVAPFLAVNGR